MKSLSQVERQEVLNLLSCVREQKLAALNAADPGWQTRVEARKNKVAIGRLKVEKEVVELEVIETQLRELREKRDSVNLRITKKMPLQKREKHNARSCPSPKDLCEAIAEIAEEVTGAETAKDPTGKKFLVINAEHLAAKTLLAKCNTREDVAAMKIL